MLHAVFSHAYFFLIPLAILEGPLLAIVCGIAAGLGALNPFVAYGILIGGDLGPDLMYYSIGRWGATLPFVRRYASRIRAIRKTFLSLEQLWHTHPLATSDVVRAYAWIGALWAEALRSLGAADACALSTEQVRALPPLAKDDPLRLACYGLLSPWEVVIGAEPRKLVGLCQTRRRPGALYQTGVYLRLDAPALANLLALDPASRVTLSERLAHAAAGLDEASDSAQSASAIMAAFERTLASRHGAALLPSAWLPSELAHADRIERERFQRLG